MKGRRDEGTLEERKEKTKISRRDRRRKRGEKGTNRGMKEKHKGEKRRRT